MILRKELAVSISVSWSHRTQTVWAIGSGRTSGGNRKPAYTGLTRGVGPLGRAGPHELIGADSEALHGDVVAPFRRPRMLSYCVVNHDRMETGVPRVLTRLSLGKPRFSYPFWTPVRDKTDGLHEPQSFRRSLVIVAISLHIYDPSLPSLQFCFIYSLSLSIVPETTRIG
jgi:hypothetical protein